MKLANIKVAKLWYYCGLGGMCVGIVSVIWGTIVGEIFPVAHGIGWLFFGLGFNRIGASEIKRYKSVTGDLGQIQREFLTLKAFQKENCGGCRFADKEVLGKPVEEVTKHQGWCTRPKPPECDDKYCYSREVTGSS